MPVSLIQSRRLRLIGPAVMAGALLGLGIFAERTSRAASQPSLEFLSASRPFLQSLNEESQSLFRQVSPCIVRLQLPLPGEISAMELDQITHDMNPVVRRQIEDVLRRSAGSSYFRVEISPTTQPGGLPGQHTIFLRAMASAANSMGVVISDQGHIAIPWYVDRQSVVQPILVTMNDGESRTAKFIGSDRRTGLTVMQLDRPAGKPVQWGESPLPSGSLALVFSLHPEQSRWSLWNGTEPDPTVVAGIDGTIAGFTRAGQFVSAKLCRNILTQLVEHGAVRRAFLGVRIVPVGADDAQRKLSSLGDAPALRVVQVLVNSPAARAGIEPGDIILKLSDQPVGDVPTFAAAIADLQRVAHIEIMRQGQIILLSAALELVTDEPSTAPATGPTTRQ